MLGARCVSDGFLVLVSTQILKFPSHLFLGDFSHLHILSPLCTKFPCNADWISHISPGSHQIYVWNRYYRFRSITKQYFRKADGVILMYDVTSEQSFLNVRNWIDSVKAGVDENCVMCLVGNKAVYLSSLPSLFTFPSLYLILFISLMRDILDASHQYGLNISKRPSLCKLAFKKKLI